MSPSEELLRSRIPTETAAQAPSSNDLLARLPADLRNEARALMRDVQAVAEGLRAARRRATIELAPRIATLKEKFGRWGGPRVASFTTKSAFADLPPPSWEEFVTAAFGVSVDTVDRWLDDYEARGRFVRLLKGEEVKYTKTDPLTNAKVEVVVSPKKFTAEQLTAELDAIDLGNKPATRAWAGLQTGQPKGSKRAAVQHEENIARGLKKLGTSLEHWASLSPAGRARCESLWNQLRNAGVIPSTWL